MKKTVESFVQESGISGHFFFQCFFVEYPVRVKEPGLQFSPCRGPVANFGVLSAGDNNPEQTLGDFLNDPKANDKVDYLFIGQDLGLSIKEISNIFADMFQQVYNPSLSSIA